MKPSVFSRILAVGVLLISLSDSRVPANAQAQKGSKVTIRPDGTTLVNGKPFFPFGFFFSEVSLETELKSLKLIADAGFNTISAKPKILDEAAKRKVMVFCYVSSPEEAAKFKSKPGVLAWAVGDDVHNGKSGTPAEVRAYAASFKKVDANHPTGTPIYDETYHSDPEWRKKAPEATRKYANVSDLIALELYPIDSPFTQPEFSNIGQTELCLQNVQNANLLKQPIWALPQSFAWDAKHRAPNAKEARNQIYTCLINGAKGLISYAFCWHVDKWTDDKPYTWNLGDTENRELWDGYKSLVPEIKRLESVLLDGKRTKVLSGDVAAAHWVYNNRLFVVVANESPTEERQVHLPLPSGVKGVLHTVFPGRPEGLSLEGNALNGKLGPADVYVYELSYRDR